MHGLLTPDLITPNSLSLHWPRPQSFAKLAFAVYVGLHAAQGLKWLHKTGTAVMDVKAANILLARRGVRDERRRRDCHIS